MAQGGARPDLRAPFEPVRCDVFITESTFGLPIYRWCPDAELFAGIDGWWARNVLAGRADVLACCSVRGTRRRGGWDRGFVLSDHADRPGLLHAIAATGAQRVIVTHGSGPVLARFLGERGLRAELFDTEYGGDAVEADTREPAA